MLVIMLVVSKQATFCFSGGILGGLFFYVCVIVEKKRRRRRKVFCRITRLTGRSTEEYC